MSRVLHNLGLSAEAVADRRNWFGGSDAPRLMGRDDAAVLDLWQEKRGEAPPSDLSAVLPVQMGSFTEPLNLDWYELTTGRAVDREQEQVIHPSLGFVRVTLDGATTTEAGAPAILQAKHVNAFSKIEDVVARYQPQVQLEMASTGMNWAVLSVFLGTMKYECVEIPADGGYQYELLAAIEHFWSCVKSGNLPVAPQVAVPAPTNFRAVDMTGSNEWASSAAEWLANKDAAKTFETAAKSLKAMVEDDVDRAYGHGIEIKRSKVGALSVKEMKNAA